jgi:hypothetical protein
LVGRESKTGLSGGQTALAVIVVAGTGAAALLLRPGAGVLRQGRGPLGGGWAAIGATALWAVAAFAVHRRFRDRFSRYEEHRDAAAQRLADVARHILRLAPLVVPALLLALHHFSTGEAMDYRPGPPRPHPPPVQTPPKAPPKPADAGRAHVPGWLADLLVGLLVAVLAAVVVYAVWYLLRLLHRPEPATYEGSYATMDDEQEMLAQAVDSGRRALLDGADARAAVIACYAAMEASLGASGVARRASDSPQDLLERAAAGDVLTGPAAGDLTDLFREARYSTHPMDDGHRRRASAALSEIAAQLERRTAAAGAAS